MDPDRIAAPRREPLPARFCNLERLLHAMTMPSRPR
jgi:hypothetical protein